MSRSVNKIILIGNVGGEPEVRALEGGGRVANFSLATSRQWTDEAGERREKTHWHRCNAWNTRTQKLADVVEKFVRKGARIYVEGSLEYREWQDHNASRHISAEITIRELVLLDKGAGAGEPAAARSRRVMIRTYT